VATFSFDSGSRTCNFVVVSDQTLCKNWCSLSEKGTTESVRSIQHKNNTCKLNSHGKRNSMQLVKNNLHICK